MTRFVLAVVFALGALSVGPNAWAEKALNDILPEMSLGSPDAPVTIYEHSSLTCGHCAHFHTTTLPKIKEKYIDTGKVRLVFRDFPLGQLALVAAMLPHCAGPERYFGFLDVLFRTQGQWAAAENPAVALQQITRMGGMSKDEFGACLDRKDLYRAIRERALDDQTVYGIDATPTFRIGGETIAGALPFEDFEKVIDAALAKKR